MIETEPRCGPQGPRGQRRGRRCCSSQRGVAGLDVASTAARSSTSRRLGGIRPVSVHRDLQRVEGRAPPHDRASSRSSSRPAVRVNAVAPGLVKTHFARALWETDEDGDRRVATRCGASGRPTTSPAAVAVPRVRRVVVDDRRDPRPRRRDVAGLASGGVGRSSDRLVPPGAEPASSRERRRSSRYATTCL